MKVIVRDRNQGKTTALIKWLLEGNLQRPYPQWNRVIVVPSTTMVAHTSNFILRTLNDMTGTEEFLCSKSSIHLKDECKREHMYTEAAIVKSVWRLSELTFNARGIRAEGFEYAVDDIDELLQRTLGFKPPAMIAMTGESVDHLGD